MMMIIKKKVIMIRVDCSVYFHNLELKINVYILNKENIVQTNRRRRKKNLPLSCQNIITIKK
jgi:hypothetical protein